MIINATLLVQIVHFGITYLILSRVLLYPGVKMMLREDEAHERVLQDISTLQQRLSDYEAFRKQQWHGCVQALAKSKPTGPYFQQKTAVSVSLDEDMTVPSEQVCIDQMRDTIVRKVSHD